MNNGAKKFYVKYYIKHKEIYKVTDDEEIKIRASKILKKYYSNEEIDEFIKNRK